MKKIILFLILISVLMTMSVTGKERQLNITSLDIKFDKTDAIFTINYDFGALPKFYLLMVGSKSIEPKIQSIFSNFDYEIIKIDQDKTILRIKNISRLEKGYYLHDSRKFGETIDVVNISDMSKSKKYFNIDATPNYFYES